MDVRVDAKGKHYTTRVNKQSTAVIARVLDTIVMGSVHVTPDNRLKDELNSPEVFIAITDAEIWPVHGAQPLYTTEVLIVNKSQLAWIFPRTAAYPPAETDDSSSSDQP
jgi:hypothetical protein